MFVRKVLRKLVADVASNDVKLTFTRSLNAFVKDDKYVMVQENATEGGDADLQFPTIWLRDNCVCAECFHQSSQSRAIDWNKFDTSVRVVDLKTNESRQQLHIKWSDSHESTYDLSWLRERDFSENRRRIYLDTFYRPKSLHWSGVNFNKILQYFDFQNVMQCDDALRSWLEALSIYGVAIVKDAPLEKSVVRQLANRVGFIRKTTYGEEFIVQNKPGAKNYAYLSTPLPLHTDLPYYEYKPSVNILHCIEQSHSAGGQNLLVDAFYIADCLRELYAKEFDILTQTLVDWNDIGSEDGLSFHNIWRAPVICLDDEGKYTRINHSIPQRDSHFSIALEQVIPWYEAYKKFVNLANNNAHAFKMAPGDVLTFNNIRLLHGRTGYDDTADNVRYIVGAYLDWDIIYSRLRVLKISVKKLQNTET